MRTIIFQDFLRGIKYEAKVYGRQVIVSQREPRHEVVCDVTLRTGEDALFVANQYVTKRHPCARVTVDNRK